jgi:hypothetical protein
VERSAVTASADYRLSPTTTFGGGVGAGTGGLITVGARRFQVQPGWEVTLSYSRQLLDGRGGRPFLILGISGGASGARTRDEGYVSTTEGATAGLYAFDVRGGLTIGKTFWNRISPYAAARVFGGPVFWSYGGSSVLGGDQYHFQMGIGLVAALGRGFDAFVEGIGAGERALTLGVGKTL